MQRYKLTSDAVKHHACRQVMVAEFGHVVTIGQPTRSGEQNAKLHAMIGDIAAQCEFMGKRWDLEDWKRLLVDAFARTMVQAGTPLSQGGRIVPALDGEGFVQLGVQTRRLRVREAAEFVEYLNAWGAENGVRFRASDAHMDGMP